MRQKKGGGKDNIDIQPEKSACFAFPSGTWGV